MQINRVVGHGSDIKAKLESDLSENGPYGSYLIDSRKCGPSAPLAGTMYTCLKDYYESSNALYYMALNFGWTNVVQSNPSSADGYWTVVEAVKGIDCQARTTPCQFRL
jgi:hypothetical protein